MVQTLKKLDGCIAILIALIAPMALWAQQTSTHQHEAQLEPQLELKIALEDDWRDLTASMERMHTAMGSIKPSGNCDADFVRLMLPHHQAAIDMARTQLMYGKDPQMGRMAQEIITDQQSEIDLMELWLKQHVPDAPQAGQTPNSAASEEQKK